MIGDRLSELRKNKGMKQEELGKALTLSKNAISSYECEISEPPDATKIKIAKLFNVSVDYLLGVSDYEYSFKEGVKYLELPPDFPDNKMENLREYAEFLAKRR